MQDLSEYRREVDRALAERRGAAADVARLRHELEVEKRAARHATAAQQFLQEVGKSVQEHAHKQIAGVVTRCLRAVFGGDYEFRIVFEKKRGKTEGRLAFFKDGEEVDPEDGEAGGVLDVAAWALRLSCLLIQRPRRRRTVVLDEPFKHVSKEYIGRVADMLLAISDELGVQFILVTHNRRLRVGKVIQL